jgi:hypothetical protein
MTGLGPDGGTLRGLRAFSGKVDTGFPSENATNQEEVGRFPIPLNRKAP